MTGYKAPPGQGLGAREADLLRRLAVLEQQMARLTGGAVAVTSTTHPTNPFAGMQIFETDTQLTAMWTGTAWLYPPQLLAQQTLSAAGSINLNVPSGGNFSLLRVVWTGASNAGGTATYMCCRFNGDSSASHYEWQINQANTTSQSSSGSAGTLAQIQVGTLNSGGGTSGYLGSGEFIVPNANGSQFKEPTGFSNSINSATNAFSGTYGGQWLSTAAVTSIQLLALSGSLIAGSSAWLYGMP